MVRLVLQALLVGCVTASVMNMRRKVGEKVELNLGKDVRTWEREVNGKTQQIRFCSPTEKNVACGSWVD
ncbi:hypothetical protein PMAYCL1PPCAC_13349, partial [Pristionchus mayeri]